MTRVCNLRIVSDKNHFSVKQYTLGSLPSAWQGFHSKPLPPLSPFECFHCDRRVMCGLYLRFTNVKEMKTHGYNTAGQSQPSIDTA